jgi:hypothetical protein
MMRIFEMGASLPFAVKRCFVISHVPKNKTRGEHAIHFDQFVAVLVDTFHLTIRNNQREVSVRLSRRTEGVLVRKGTWLRLDQFTRGTLLLVCASQMYRPNRNARQRSETDG